MKPAPAQLGLGLEAPQKPRTGALRSYHVRSHVPVPEALEGERRAARQEETILAFLRGMTPQRYTPSEIQAVFPRWPLTSVRRALTNLTTLGLLTHHRTNRRPGPFGAKESTWSLSVSLDGQK
jgi:hypothetical protein